MVTLSACVITFNEEENISRCLKSLSFADEIIVIDSLSTDRTVEIARNYTSKVFSHQWLGFGPQKNLAFSKATGDWIINVDADEELTSELAKEITEAINNPQGHIVFNIPRKNLVGGYWVKYGSCFHNYPDSQPRLFRRGQLNCGANLVHEGYLFNGKNRSLQNFMIHHSYKDFKEYRNSMNYFSRLKALDLIPKKLDYLCLKFGFLPFHAVITFLSYYLVKKGVLMGLTGIRLAYEQTRYVTRKYSLGFWWKLTKKDTEDLKKQILEKNRC